MRLELNDKRWNLIYYSLRQEYLNEGYLLSRHEIIRFLKERYDVVINTDDAERWENVDIPDDLLTLLLLKYKGTFHDA